MSIISELDVMSLVNNKFGGVSTTLKNSILSYIGTNPGPSAPFTIIDYQLTTQTIVLEISGINFNDFTLDPKKFGQGIQNLFQSSSKSMLLGLRRIASKRF